MLLLAKPTGHQLRDTVGHWKTIARDTLRALEDWRDAPDFYFEDPPARTFDFAFEPRAKQEATVQSFLTCTTELSRAAIDLPLDPRPLQAVFNVVSDWNRTLVADQIPDQRRVRAMFDAASLVVDTVEARIRRRVKVRPEPASQPVAPVAVNGRKHATVPVAEAPRRQTRLSVKLDATPPYIILDGTPHPAPEASVRFLAALIDANGYTVPFKRWLKDYPEFVGLVSTRVVKGIPEQVRALIDCPGKGHPPLLKVEELLAQ